jgi:hypothetical protein
MEPVDMISSEPRRSLTRVSASLYMNGSEANHKERSGQRTAHARERGLEKRKKKFGRIRKKLVGGRRTGVDGELQLRWSRRG